jgi:hypothetical protein
VTEGRAFGGRTRRMLKALGVRWLARTEVAHWADLAHHDPTWDARTQRIAELVPKGARVIEFGAGRRRLQDYLDSSCRYFPSDLVSRGPDTLVHDLNRRPLPDLSGLQLDAAVFSGVLEYIRDLPSLTRWLSRHVGLCIASYECAASSPRTVGRLLEIIRRAAMGWINSYTEAELVALFRTAGFTACDSMTFSAPDGDGRIFVFRKPAYGSTERELGST